MRHPLLSFISADKRPPAGTRVMYFGRASEFLRMTSESLPVPEGGCTLGQMLERLRSRGPRWAYELDGRHIACTIDGENARQSATVKAGMEIGIYSRKSIFEP